MALTIQNLIDSARGTLIDAAKVTWSDEDLVTYANEGIQATCNVKPDAYSVQVSVSLAGGVIQQLPAGATGLLDLMYASTGGSIPQVDKAMLEAADPQWAAHAQVGASGIEHYMVDPRDPLRYLIYPPVVAGTAVTMIHTAVPATVVAGSSLPLVDSYGPPIIDYILHRAYAKNTKRQDLTKASFCKQQWGAAVGLKAKAQIALTPHINEGTPT